MMPTYHVEAWHVRSKTWVPTSDRNVSHDAAIAAVRYWGGLAVDARMVDAA